MTDSLNVVVDISHHNGILDFQQAAAAGIVGVIHKATQGLSFKDSMYQINRQKALDAGLLWGAYHFVTGAGGAAQADFLADTLLMLDYEPNAQGATMTLDQARAFVSEVNDKVGRFPGLYSGNLIKEQLGNNSDETLAQCFFWLAQYGPTPVGRPTGNLDSVAGHRR